VFLFDTNSPIGRKAVLRHGQEVAPTQPHHIHAVSLDHQHQGGVNTEDRILIERKQFLLTTSQPRHDRHTQDTVVRHLQEQEGQCEIGSPPDHPSHQEDIHRQERQGQDDREHQATMAHKRLEEEVAVARQEEGLTVAGSPRQRDSGTSGFNVRRIR